MIEPILPRYSSVDATAYHRAVLPKFGVYMRPPNASPLHITERCCRNLECTYDRRMHTRKPVDGMTGRRGCESMM